MLNPNGFKRKRFADIFSEMEVKAKEVYGQQINTSERSALGILLRLVAWFLGRLWQSLEDVYYSSHVHSATGRSLDRLGANFNLSRTLAQPAKGQVTIMGTPLFTVPVGFRLKTATNMIFETLEAHTLDSNGSATVLVQAVEAGSNGNVGAGTIVTIVNPDANIVSSLNTAETYGGLDTENDPVFRSRILTKTQNPGTSGNAADYMNWALNVMGIGKAKVFPLWNGPGTVKVVLVDTEKLPASLELVTEVTTYIEKMRPIGAEVSVNAARSKTLNISVQVTLAPGTHLQTVIEAFKVDLDVYLEENALTTSYISIAKIGTILLGVPGVLDYKTLLLNSTASNVLLQSDEIAVMGLLTVGV
ncbi:baseplate J/gp47 family protein [Paenibacillus sp. L3-i20]|uniref:baseplate J/gp47 family protein n=1 Tax=Paenibacillus sp. L3-i20 TaxID=2905833 RepID=UPI001EDEE3BA|nr:baseplate J/gp47 family protein [Paenibacillus sp. L3-i20]GKU78572.1 hypothetical protein L3i20_v229690 [Paenibacillus sp. L3-i20]